MNTAVIGYPNSVNLGDWIQSLIIYFIWQKEFAALDREQLHAYRGPKTKLICNGWFMENPKHWPPASTIHPLFVSFHINPTAEEELTNRESLKYFKHYEPIGCRDIYTLDLLKSRGIQAYFSGCLTLCYQKSYLSLNPSQTPSGILVTSVFDRLKPIVQFTRSPSIFLRQLLKYPLKYVAYHIATRRLRKFLSKTDQSITYASQIIDEKTLRTQDSKAAALNYLKKVASAEFVITSRIHTALPATAMGIPVLFLNDGLNHINHRSRLSGIEDLFNSCSSKKLKDVDLKALKVPSDHIELSSNLKATIDQFLISEPEP